MKTKCHLYAQIIKYLVLIWIPRALTMSSLIQLTENHKLSGRVTKSQRTYDIMACAHLCVLSPLCDSLNYLANTADTGMCELNRLQSEFDHPIADDDGWTYGKLTSEDKSFTFTTLGAKGKEGPVDTSMYKHTSLNGKVQLDQGIQIWTVPETGNYVIKALGASGGNGTNTTTPRIWILGGKGASIQGTVFLHKNERLRILVGQQGHPLMEFAVHPGSGGGGSFVTLMDNTPLVIAGGGGGGWLGDGAAEDGDPGQASGNGTLGGGWGGRGGKLVKEGPKMVNAAAGGGLSMDGQGQGFFTDGGQSFIGGGRGGRNKVASGGKGIGGFGGGGACNSDAGGGGGYSGGGVTKREGYSRAGGGGSFNVGKDPINESGVNQGDGKVIIRLFT